jgi:segregation and condensation protein A
MKSQQLSQAGGRPALQVQLPSFEGPFALSIYLVERDKLDIYDIAIADITSSYIESLKILEQFDPELASDFIYMAAYLLELKSRSLLPRIERRHLTQEPDPRQELIMRLVEYKRFKELAAHLDAMTTQGNQIFSRGPSLSFEAEETRPLAPMSLDNLFSAFFRALEKHRVEIRELPGRGVLVAEKMSYLRQKLGAGPQNFNELTAGLGLSEIIVIFLAVLELVKMGEAGVYQDSVFSPIIIEPVIKDDANE